MADHKLGVAGFSGEPLGSPRSAGYPMPAIPQTFLDKAYARALTGTEYELRATPQARNSVSGNGRPACCGNASCIPICPIGAKYDATVHLSLAERNGALVHPQTTAMRVEVGTEGRVTAIRFKRWDGSEGVASGKVFVHAAHAIETPRLLLHSRSEALPNGVANRSGQVGRNLMDHPTQLSWALSREPVWPYRGPLSTSSIETFRHGASRKDRPAMRIEIGNDGWSWPKGAPVSTAAELARQGLRGSELNAALRDQAARHVRLASQVEQLPDPNNRVTLDSNERDMYGVPLPRLAYRPDDYVRAGLAAARAAHAEIFERLGSTGIEHRNAPEGAGHIMGTARMGNDPKSSVVDRDLRSHDHPNLFILGSAVFPTGATANPTLTIAALSLRSAGSVKAALSQ